VEASNVHETRMRRWVHTALQGYLIKISREANISHNSVADITALFQPQFCCVISGLSLAYIGTASITEFGVSLRVDPRWFRLGDEKEAAGGGDAVMQAGIMDFEYGLGME
jgi:hypothetical protein